MNILLSRVLCQGENLKMAQGILMDATTAFVVMVRDAKLVELKLEN